MKNNIVIIFFLLLQTFVSARHLRSDTHFADALSENDMYTEAITEYKRLLFSTEISDPEILGVVWLSLAKCYRNSNNAVEAMKCYGKSYHYLECGKQLDLLYRELCVFYISRGKCDLAREVLEKMKPCPDDRTQQHLTTLSYLVENNWDGLLHHLTKNGIGKTEIEKIQRIVRKMDITESRRHFLDILSLIFPGGAYLFDGNFGEGCKSLLIDYLFFNQALFASTPLEVVLNGFLFVKMFSRSQEKWKSHSESKSRAKKLEREEKIFEILFGNTIEQN